MNEQLGSFENCVATRRARERISAHLYVVLLRLRQLAPALSSCSSQVVRDVVSMGAEILAWWTTGSKLSSLLQWRLTCVLATSVTMQSATVQTSTTAKLG